MVILSNNNYKIYLVLQALSSLLFPFVLTQYCLPLSSIKILNEVFSNKPIIIGINSENCLSYEDIIAIDPELNVLDIDSNFIYSFNKFSMCDCIVTELGQKIQYLKAFYYIEKERLSIFRMSSLEKIIKDQAFIHKARILFGNINGHVKDEIFVELIRETFFFLFFKYMHDYNSFIAIQSLTGVLEFQSDLFLERLEKCANCTQEAF